MVSGDHAVCEEAKQFFGDVETACVKWAVSRNRARCLEAKAGCQLVHETCKKAVQRAALKHFQPYRPKTPATMDLEFQRNDYADAMASNPAFTRTGPRSIRWTANTLQQLRIV